MKCSKEVNIYIYEETLQKLEWYDIKNKLKIWSNDITEKIFGNLVKNN